jgi:hypothetical protein
MAEIIKFPRPFRSREVPKHIADRTPPEVTFDEAEWTCESAYCPTGGHYMCDECMRQADEPCWLAADPSDPECVCPECLALRNDLEPIAPAQSEPPKDPTE